MNHSATIHSSQKESLATERFDCLEEDPRWGLVQRVVTSRHFARSRLLSKFLLHVVTETLEDRQSEITEHQIGVRVFGRSPEYRTVEDNIVRNYARQLRKRLAEYFAGEGSAETLRVEIPHGGYVPVFPCAAGVNPAAKQRRDVLPVKVQTQVASNSPLSSRTAAGAQHWQHWLLRASVLAACGAAVICVSWFAAGRVQSSRLPLEPTQRLWSALLSDPENTYIVPADAGFNLVEDLSHHPLSLADYIGGGYLRLPLAPVDSHSAEDLRSQEFTSFVDLQIVTRLARQPEFNPQKVFLRFPRDLRLDDLKNANAVIIGSVGSNPWAAIADGNANFRIIYREDMQAATIVNTKPQTGEAVSYVSHWNEPAHETFALISFLPNLTGNGHLLLLEGLDVAGTQAAAEALFSQSALDPVIRQAIRKGGSLRCFEVLLRSTSIQSNAAGAQIIAFRIH
jgi:hypothetical protein